MKKNIVLSILAVVIIAAIGLFAVKNKGDIFSVKDKGMVSKKGTSNITVNDLALIAEETDVCMILSDMGQLVNAISGSAFGKEFATLPVWNYLDLDKNIKEITGAFNESLGADVNKEQLLSLFSKKIAMGVDINANVPVITLLAEVDSASVSEIQKLFLSAENKDSIVEETYQDTKIYFLTSANPEQPNISYIVFDNSIAAMIIGGTIDEAKAMIERKSGLKKSLVSNAVVQDALSNNFAGDGFFFLNLDTLNQEQAAANPATAVTTLGGEILKHIVGEINFDGGMAMNLKIYPNKAKMSPEIKDMWFVDPKKLSVLNYAPAGTLFFTGSTQMNFKQLYDSWKVNLDEQNTEIANSILENVEKLKETNQINIEDEVIPNLGNEMAVVCSAIEAKGLMPVIEIGFIIEVLNQKLIQKNLDMGIKAIQDAVATRAGQEGVDTATVLKLETEAYNNVDIIKLQLPFMVGQALSPCYAFVDKYLVISTSVTGVKKLIDVRGGKVNSLKGSAAFGKVKDMLPETTNQMGFVDITTVLESAISLSEWIISFQKLSVPQGDSPEAVAQRQEAQQTEVLIRDNLIPLLKTLKVVKVLGVNTLNSGNDEYIEQYFKMVVEDNTQAA